MLRKMDPRTDSSDSLCCCAAVGGSSLTGGKLNDCIAMAHKRASHVRSLIESALASVER